jgi:SAM-dependent methyltransferase
MEWAPAWYHLYMRRYLVFYYRLFQYFKLWIPAISDFIEKTGSHSYLECCAGSGEVLGLLVSRLPENLVRDKNFVLSDISPLPEFVEQVNAKPDSAIRYSEIPIDATRIPEKLDYPRIFINSFHHFPPETVSQIIDSSIQSKQGIIILEYVRHSVLGYLSMLSGSLMILVTLPFVVKPRDLPLMALLTYILPLFPLMFLWDGIVSCLRVYSAEELSALISEQKIPAKLSSFTKRSLLYPAGVLAITIIPRPGKT